MMDQQNASDLSCFCDPWRAKTVVARDGILGAYTDADLAKDMNTLSFAERQAMEEDIHGVADVIEETSEFVTKKIEEMRQALASLSSIQRQSWDRAVFLRPGLAKDRGLHLIFLRARQFRVKDAAQLMASYFRAKRDLFGDDLLIHRITWNDLTTEEQSIFRSGASQLIPNHDRTGRGVLVIRMSKFDFSGSASAMARCLWYVHTVMEDDPMMQRKGVVSICDYRGKWISSPFQFIRLNSTFPTAAIPIHFACMHNLYINSSAVDLIQILRNLLPKDIRTRVRSHSGSSLEMEYALRTFGIDVSNELFRDHDPSLPSSDDYNEGIEEDIRRRQYLDDEYRRYESSFRGVESPIALFPNPQDIIMGRNKAVALTWTGNVLYRKVIEEHVHRYIVAQVASSDRISKTMIAVEVLHLLQDQYKARFLNREDDRWVVVDDSEAQVKISQALRASAKEQTTPR